jgi:archaellum component FlaF (FlaF/FlaG flagellin family)
LNKTKHKGEFTMKKALLFAMLLAVLALGTLSAQIREIYSQPYPADADGMPAVRQAYTSILATAQNFDFRFADNFNGLTDPINQITFYGVSTFWNGYWVATEPAATEPFHVRFYNYTGSWTQSPQSLIAEETGTYTVNLYDSYDDGWGRSKLDVLVNGVVVLQSITLASGAGPEAYTFFANAGDVISTIFTAGSYAYENWYEILDPNNFVIATDGEGDSVPTGLNIPQPLIAPETGTYTVNLYDNYGDGWDGSRLNVYVNGIVVLEGITLAAGYGPEAYTFTANTGDEICAVFRAGDYPDENWYEILDPNGVIIATDGPDPQGIGFVSTYEVDEPDWNNPAYEYLALDVSTTYIGPTNLAGNSGFYQYDIILPEAVNMAEGWVSVQASIDDGATTWFMWSVCDVAYGDGSSWQYVAAKSRNRVNNAYVTDGNVRGHIPRDVAFTLYTDDDITVPGPESTLGGTLPDELQGTDAIIYTVESTGIRNVTVLKPAEFTGEWYCWLQDIVGLRAAANPIPADTESWTFYEVLFEAKAPVTVVIDERDLNRAKATSWVTTSIVTKAWI